jgi:hypothetical protein
MVNDGFAQPLRRLMKRSRAELGAETAPDSIPKPIFQHSRSVKRAWCQASARRRNQSCMHP